MAECRQVGGRQGPGDCWALGGRGGLLGASHSLRLDWGGFGFRRGTPFPDTGLTELHTYSGHSLLPVSNTSKIDKNKQEFSFPECKI